LLIEHMPQLSTVTVEVSGLVQGERAFEVYSLFFFWLWLRYIRDIKSGGYFFVTLEHCFITNLLVILIILLIWFHHMDTILVVLLVC